MKQNTLKWLSYSAIILCVLSCKKQKGILDDFDSGKFDFVCIRNIDGVQDTTTGEVSGPDGSSIYNHFMVKQELTTINTLKNFKVGSYTKMIDQSFSANGLSIGAKITYEEHDADHLMVTFQNTNPSVGLVLTGSFKLTRKE
jgi:hypothetical protein